MCSILGEASAWGTPYGAAQGVDRIAAAIDQLEAELRAQPGAPGMTVLEATARVAGIWLMVTALDPELSRLISRYTAAGNPADGTESLGAGFGKARRGGPRSVYKGEPVETTVDSTHRTCG